MDVPTRGAPRALRACVVAAACTVVSVGGHLWGGGRVPGLTPMAVVAVVALILGWAGSRRRWTFGRLVVVLAGSQVGCHVLFEYVGGGSVADSASLSMMMTAGHALAVVLLAAFLGYGETLLWRLGALSAVVATQVRQWGRAPRLTPVLPRSVALPAPRAGDDGISAVLVAEAPRRGPPAPGFRRLSSDSGLPSPRLWPLLRAAFFVSFSPFLGPPSTGCLARAVERQQCSSASQHHAPPGQSGRVSDVSSR